MLIQAASVFGAILILIAYAGHQAGWMGRDTHSYHLINLVGALILCFVAVRAFQLGFILLESIWSVISLAAIIRLLRTPSPHR